MSTSEVLSSMVHGLGELETALTCILCFDVFEEPVAIGQCGHTFCKKCIDKYLGKECPTCKIPVNVKESYSDKQLADLLPLVQQLKTILQSEAVSEEHVDQSVKMICETPVLGATKQERSVRVVKPSKCAALNCCKSPESSRVSALQPVENIVMETPKNSLRIQRKALTTPGFKKRSPFKFNVFSAKKKLCSKPVSPRLQGAITPLNIEKRNGKGETLLHVAVIKGDLDRVKFLLSRKANPNVKDHAGWTPLHEASNRGYFEITKLLVEHGAVLDVPGRDGITPLHDAVMNHCMEVACYLASKGADINARTSLENSALDLCESEDAKKSLLKHSTLSTITHVNTETQVLIENSNRKTVLLSTSLDEEQKVKLQKFANLVKAEIFDDFSPEVTHIVTSCDENGQCNRTLKILQGILSGKWIVNFQWIEVCLEYKKHLPEEAFEVPGTKQQPDVFGPKRSRENANLQHPPLFDGCNFYIYGQISSPMPPKEGIYQLIQLGGGKILTREPRAETVNLEEHLIPYHAAGTSLEDISHFILYQDKPPRQTHIRTNHICTVTVLWFIECICTFQLCDPNKNTRA